MRHGRASARVGARPCQTVTVTSAWTSTRFAVLLTAASGAADAYALMTHGVMANAQTGNVVLLAASVARSDWWQVAGHLWSVGAFVVGTVLATHLKRTWIGEGNRSPVADPVLWTVVGMAFLLVCVGLLPATTPSAIAIVPQALIGGMSFELFRKAAGLAYVPVTATGNLVRLVEDIHGTVARGDEESRRALPVHTAIVVAFTGGCVLGGLATHLWGVRGIWLAAAFIAVDAALLVVERRRTPRPMRAAAG